MGFRVVVDDLCESNAVCMGIAADVFEVGDDDELHLLVAEPDESRRQRVQTAVECCPKQALRIDEL